MKEHIHNSHLTTLALNAGVVDRGRSHMNTHESIDANVQRLFIATMPKTYIRPHRHSDAHKWEFFVLLEGSMDLVIFGDDGTLVERTRLSRIDVRAVEIPPGTWHSYICSEPGTIALEVKEGAYSPAPEHDLAPWSPPEKSELADDFLDWMRVAEVGTKPPAIAGPSLVAGHR